MKNKPKELLTFSRLSSFKECRKKHHLAYNQGLRKVDDARALRIGSAFHAGIESLVLADPLNAACQAVMSHYASMPVGFDQYWWEIERETVLRLVCGYQWRWQNANLEVIATELPFRITLINPATGHASLNFDLGGKIDGIVRLEDGRLAVKETKTTSDDIGPDADVWRRLRMDHQITLYLIAARELGYPVDTVLYDICRKPSVQPTPIPFLDGNGMKIVLDGAGHRVFTKQGKPRQTADAKLGYVLQVRPMTPSEWGDKITADIGDRPDFYYTRREIPRLDCDLGEFRDEIWQIQQAVREAQRNGKHYRTVTKNCVYCPFFEPCSSGHDFNTAPIGFHFVDDVHPELNGEVNELTSIKADATANEATSCATAEAVPIEQW